MKILAIVVCFASVVMLASVLWVNGTNCKADEDALVEQLSKLQDFCTKTALALDDDALALQSSDPKLREIAYARFYASEIMYHNAQSILMCVEPSKMPTWPSLCWIDKDVECLSRAAAQMRDALRSAPTPISSRR